MTVRVVFAEIVPKVAVMVVVPAVRGLDRPLLLTVATNGLDELQVTCEVISRIVPSENVAVAVNCWVVANDMAGLGGVTTMEDRVPGVTVRVVLPETVPEAAVIVAVPAAMAVARPLLLTTATVVLDELQVTCVVMSWVVRSEKIAVAVNCWVVPAGMLRSAGVTAMEETVAEVTVRVVLPEAVPEVAVMVAVPVAMAVDRPLLLTVATNGLDELQVTCVLISRVVPSEKVPVAVNCWVVATEMTGLAGVKDMEDGLVEATVRVVLPETVPEVAVMVTVPVAMAVTRPLLVTAATVVLDELQVTCAVISWVVSSENVAVAVNCWVAATDMTGLAGVTAMEDRVAEVTVRVVLPETVPEVAVTVVVPAARAVARPLMLTVATNGLDELQVTCADISWVVPSENVAVAVNCWVVSPGMLGLAGVTSMEDRVAEVTVRVVLSEIDPEVAVMVAVPAVRAVTTPLLLTTATEVSDELQVTSLVISPPGAPANVPLAVNCWVDPVGMIGLSGVTVMEVGCSIPPPHPCKDTAKDPRINIVRINLKFFMRHPTGKNRPRPLAGYRRTYPYPHRKIHS